MLPQNDLNLFRQPVADSFKVVTGRLNLLPNTGLGLDSAAVTGLATAGYGNQATVGFAPGFAGVLSLGWGFGNGLRAEIEGNYRSNEADSASGVAGWASLGTPGGRQESWGVMGNVLLDLGVFGPVVPYVGVGAGYVVYMFQIDVPMYWARWVADEALGRHYLPLAHGLADVSQRWVVSHDWAHWRTEVVWMSVYFSVAVWFSIALSLSPRMRTVPMSTSA